MYYFEKKSDDPYKLKRYEEAIQSYDKFQSYDKTVFNSKGNTLLGSSSDFIQSFSWK